MIAGFVVTPAIALKYWTKILPNGQELMGAVYTVGSTSFRSVIERAVPENAAAATAVWVVVTGAFVVVGMWAAHQFTRQGHTLLAVSVCGIIVAVCPPITWPHYWVWAIPGILALGRYALLLRSVPIALVALVSIAALQVPSAAMSNLAPLTLPQQAHLGAPEQLEAATYQITAILLLAVAVACVRAIDSRHRQGLISDAAGTGS
jgi:alpha-1,2-mannosyltransferase